MKSWSPGFTRIAYTRSDKPNMLLIEYRGDERIAGHFASEERSNRKRRFDLRQPPVFREMDVNDGSEQRSYQGMDATFDGEANASFGSPESGRKKRKSMPSLRLHEGLCDEPVKTVEPFKLKKQVTMNKSFGKKLV